MNETELNAKFAALCMQRNDAANVAVNLAGSLAVAQEHIKELEAQLAETVATEDAQTTIEGVENV